MSVKERKRDVPLLSGKSMAARFQGIDRCDVCGAPLPPGEAITGLCRKHAAQRRS